MTSHLSKRLETLPEGTLVFSDIDNTVVFGASVYQFGWEAFSQGFIGWRDVMPALFDQRHFVRSGENEVRMVNTRERALALVQGHSLEDFIAVARLTWEKRMRQRLFPEMVDLLSRHTALGHDVYLASASPSQLVDIMADGLGLSGGLGTVLDAVDDVFTGDLRGPLLHGPAKAEAVFDLASSKGVDPKNVVAYSDSFADMPLLEGAGHPIVVNPDRRLHQVAIRRDWPIVWPKATEKYRRHRL
jgi:HAD superfamily hydrolase (TIGR01490 family)